MVKVSIVNVVATAALGHRVDLEQLGKCPRIVHDLEIYGGRVAYFRSAEFAGEVTIFASGKMISVGTKSEGEAYRALELAKEYLVEKGFVTSVDLEKKTQNIVVVVDFETNVSLERLAQDYKMIYEPEQFPGAIFRINEPYKATALLFASGKTVIAGLKSSDQIRMALRKLARIVETINDI